jgi:hypothetical protein
MPSVLTTEAQKIYNRQNRYVLLLTPVHYRMLNYRISVWIIPSLLNNAVISGISLHSPLFLPKKSKAFQNRALVCSKRSVNVEK